MSDNLERQVDDLRAELVEAKAANEALKEKVVAEQHAEFAGKIETLEATIAEQAEKLAEQTAANEALSESLKVQEEAMAAKDEDMKEKMEELRKMKEKEAVMKRRAQLEEAGLEAEEAEATIADFDGVDDDTFDKVVALMQKKSMKMKDDEEAVMKKDKAGNCACKAEEDVELEEEQDSAEASEEVLETVEEVTEVAIAEAMGEEDPSENLRATASEWLGSILKNKPQQ